MRVRLCLDDDGHESRNVVTIGDGTTVNGHLVVATTIQDSFKTVQASDASDPIKDEFARLCSQLEAILPRRRWYELSAEGIIEAAKTCGAMATPVIATVQKILSLLGSHVPVI